MTIAYLLLFLALFLIYIEFFLPGAVFGTVGVLTLFASIVFFIREVQTSVDAILFIVVALLGIIFVIRFALKRIKKSSDKNTFFLNTDQSNYIASKYEKSVIGKEGKAVSHLKPSGYIRIENQRFQAVSQSGYITKGTPIKVIGGQGAYLIVKPAKEDLPS